MLIGVIEKNSKIWTGLGKPQGKQEQTMYKTVVIKISDLRPAVLKCFKPLLASPGYNSRPKRN